MDLVNRLSTVFSGTHTHVPSPQTEADKKLFKVVRQSSDEYEPYLDEHRNFSGISDEGLKAASIEAERKGYPARCVYLGIILESRHDKDHDLLKVATDTDEIFESFRANNPGFSGVTDQGLRAAMRATESTRFSDRSSYFMEILNSRELRSSLRNESSIVVRHSFTSSVGEKRELSEIRTVFFSESYTFWRFIRPDEDRYYRAALFGFLEQILQSPGRRELVHRIGRLCQESPLMPGDLKQRFVTEIWNMAEGISCRNRQELEGLISNKSFDADMVYAARCLLADHIIKHQGQDFHGCTLTPEMAVDVLHKEKELPRPLLKFGLLGHVLKVDLSLVYSDGNAGIPPRGGSNFRHRHHEFEVCMLSAPGLYGILYR